MFWNVVMELVLPLLVRLAACTCARSHSMVVHSNPLRTAGTEEIMISFSLCLLVAEQEAMISNFKEKKYFDFLKKYFEYL